jgi:late competence protein required for DNA uptake (superfamily II DNA/RNA helicase)
MKSHHVHRYERAILGKKGYTVFRCNLPDCNHYISAKLAEGKLTICNRCGNQMLLDRRAMKFVKPYCVDCVKVKKSDTHDKLLEFISDEAK